MRARRLTAVQEQSECHEDLSDLLLGRNRIRLMPDAPRRDAEQRRSAAHASDAAPSVPLALPFQPPHAYNISRVDCKAQVHCSYYGLLTGYAIGNYCV